VRPDTDFEEALSLITACGGFVVFILALAAVAVPIFL
jgi:hypothetical protein